MSVSVDEIECILFIQDYLTCDTYYSWFICVSLALLQPDIKLQFPWWHINILNI